MPDPSDPAAATAPGAEPRREPVTVAITRQTRPGDAAVMQAWVHAGVSLAERFPGFLGAGWVRSRDSSPEWHMLYRFSCHDDLDRWERSSERSRWLRSAGDMAEPTRVEHRTGIEGWFDDPGEQSVDDLAPPSPPRWKQAVVIWLAFFPTNLFFTWLLASVTADWLLVLRVLFMTVMLTPVMTYLVLPAMTRALQPWLQRPAPRR